MAGLSQRYGGKKRLAACVPWVKALLSGVFGLESVVNSGSLRFIVIDGSTVQEPGATETTYRLHIAIDLINLSLRQVEVTTDKVGENLDHYQLESGDVVLIDRGYNQPKTLMPFLDRGGDVVLRYNAHSMRVYEAASGEPDTPTMVKVDWESRLQTLNGQAGCFPVYLCLGNQRIPVYVHAIPLPAEKAEQARRQAKQRAQKKGGTASEKTLYLSAWVLILTSLPPELLDTQTASALYRVRWQVELLIKRLKSLLSMDELRARKHSQLAELYLHGKLLYAAAVEKIVQQQFPHAARKLDAPRQLTDWRLWQKVADNVKAGIKGCFPPQQALTEDCLKSLAERPRKRQLQALPARTMRWIELCRKLGVSHV